MNQMEMTGNTGNYALSIVTDWARAGARKAGVTTEFFMVEMNYQALTALLRELMDPRAICLDCGRRFVNELDIQIDYIHRPAHAQDWARLHAENVRLVCGACVRARGGMPFEAWLDEAWQRQE